MGKHRLTVDWANRDYVVYVDGDNRTHTGRITRYSVNRDGYHRSERLGTVGYSVEIGDTFAVT